MKMTQKAFYNIFRVLVSCFTAGSLVLFFSLLAGEDLIHNNDTVLRMRKLNNLIDHKLNDDLDKHIIALGEVPEKDTYRKFYCIELAREIQNAFRLVRKQQIMFDSYNASTFQNQLKRVTDFAELSNVQRLMDELDVVKKELVNSANLLEEQGTHLVRQRIIYFVLFFVLWVVLYLYFSRGILFRTQRQFEA